MALAYDPTTGTVIAGTAPVQSSGVPDSVLKTGKVPMLDNVGNPVFVDSKDLDSAISQGFKYESPEESVERGKEEKYGNSPFLAGTLGATRSLTFGASDLAGRGLGFADALREIKQRNELSSTAGEVAGAVAPLILTLGASAPAQTAARGAIMAGEAATVARGASALSTAARVAEVTAPSLITRGSEALAKKLVAQGWKRATAQGALEGAGFGAGQGITEIALTEGDITPDRVAESLISNIGMGAFMGGALSLGAYGIGKGIGKITDPLKNKLIGNLGAREVEALPGQLVPEANYGALEQAARKSNADDLIRLAKEAGIDEKDIPAELLLKSEKAAAQGVELGKRDTYFGWEQARKQANFKEKTAEYGAKVLDDIKPITDFEAGEVISSSLSNRISAAADDIGKGFQKARESTKFIPVSDKSKEAIIRNIQALPEYRLNSGIRSKLEEVVNSLGAAKNADELKTIATIVQKNMISPAVRAGEGETARVLGDVLGKVRRFEENSILRASIEQAPTRAQGLKVGKELAGEMATARKQWSELSGMLDDVFGKSGAKVARGRVSPSQVRARLEELGGEQIVNKLMTLKNPKALQKFANAFPEEFSTLRNTYLSRVKEQAMEETGLNISKLVRAFKSEGTSKKMSPEVAKILLGGQYKVVENLEKIVKSNPKAFVNWSNTASTSFNDSVAMGLVFNTLANIKDAALYAKLYKLPQMVESIKKTDGKINSKITQFVTHATKQTFSGIRGGAVVIANNMQEKNYQGQLDKLEDLAANPDKILDSVVDSTSGVADDPALQSALQSKGMAAANFLISKMPKKPDVHNVFGASPKYKPSDQELSKWNRYVRAVDNPMTILDDFNAGILTPESVEAVRTIYPEIYANISSKLIDKMSSVKKPISYQSKLQISTLLGTPVSSAMDPMFVQKLQQNIAQQPEQEQPQSGMKVNVGQVSKMDISGRSQTSTNKLLSR
jgi:hypothetical protein